MGEYKMENMPLPALFEQARKIHLMATDSGADQVSSLLCLIQCSFTLFNLINMNFFGSHSAGSGKERMRGAGEVRGHDKQDRAFLIQ